MTSPLLSVKDLRTYFHTEDATVKAVDGVEFDIRPGETLGIVGESGSGKSVTSLSILRLIPEPPGKFESGEIWFEGKDLLRVSEEELHAIRGNRISMIFQDPMTSLNPYLTVGRQLTEVLEIHHRKTKSQARSGVLSMLERVGISDAEQRIEQYPHQFSGGMRQRVMIAMALLCKPALLIADEPTTALDVTIQAQILVLLDDMKREFAMSILLITHDLGVVAGIADRVQVMYGGKIVESGTTEEIFARPRHPYTRGLLESIPRLNEERREQLKPIPGMPPDLGRLARGCAYTPRCSMSIEKCGHEDPEIKKFSDEHWSRCFEAEKL